MRAHQQPAAPSSVAACCQVPSSFLVLSATPQVWNERIQLGPLTTSAAPQMLLEVFAEKMGKGE